MSGSNAIAIAGVTKKFGATVALNSVTLDIPQGAVHAILGENGAGKSTLIKVLSGITSPNEGTIRVMGEERVFSRPDDAQSAGIATAFQELSQVPHLSVAQNMLMPDEPTWFGLRRNGECTRQAREILADFGLDDIDTSMPVKELDLSVRQKLEIAYAISRKPKVLLLDEPTSALTSEDVVWLGRQIERCKLQGITIVLITHRMPEVREFCTSLSILRNGACVGSFAADEISDDEVFRLIMGRTLGSAFPARLPLPDPSARPRLSVSNLGSGNRLRAVSFEIRPGECLGVVALQGMGQLELFKSLFGISPATAGTVEVDGEPVSIRSPQDAIAAHVGLSLVPEERKTEGLALNLSGRANISLPTISQFSRWGRIDKAAEARAVADALERVSGNMRALHEPASSFSGGNQQKFVIAKWLLSDSRVLLLFDPTRGVDVGAKFEIYQVMHEFLSSGGAVLLHSTEIPEVANLCDRILVMYAGRVVAEMDGRTASEHAITTAMLGGTPSTHQLVKEHS
ncbi:sugar ABC transporter ATP-binding protein [Caballeronia novacaledonica]|uniref:Sugar ABC transporter ATP-binding protein n=1 Tax=Caballeronia novacaledonica TaxID=1544861 RepID=A0AA37IE88_9BURK|nr:sugar ABC transporter ATP-binding protein [Caballeronia novacaledonica]GJH27003.1 sugar ABC transporter ATP-binding protein [Caballeronia novacaledonica]